MAAPTLVEKACTAAFGLALVLGTLPAWFVAFIGGFIVERLSDEQKAIAMPWFNRICIGVCAMGWRVTLTVCFWVGIKIEDPDDCAYGMGKTGRPSICLANHTSFMDTIVVLAALPLRQSVKVKMMVAEYVFSLPVIGNICRCMGHLPVIFKAKGQASEQTVADENNMSIDTEAMAIEQKKMDEYVAKGGSCNWFPEGRMNNGDCSKVGTFRAGGMALPVKQDVEVWCIALCGPAACWPRKAPMGGFPGRLGVHIFRFCESSHDYLAKQADLPQDDDRAKCIHLANATQKAVQEKIDKMIESGIKAQRSVQEKSPSSSNSNAASSEKKED